MREKNPESKSIETTTVVEIVVIMIVIGAGGYIALSGGDGGTEVPVYPGASEVEIPSVLKDAADDANIDLEAYDAEGSLEEIKSWYENEMPAEGWSKMGESVQGNSDKISVGWKKDGEGAGIAIQTKSMVPKSYADLFEDNIIQVYIGDPEMIEIFLDLPVESKGTVSSFDLPGSSPQGVAWDGEHLWNADENTDKIYELDTDGNVISTLESPTTSSEGLAWDGSHLWLAESSYPENNKLHKIDPDTGDAVKSVEIDVKGPAGLAWDGEHLWLGQEKLLDRKIYKLDTDGNVISSGENGEIGLASGLAWGDNHLWLADSTRKNIYKIDPPGEIVSSFDAPSNWPSGLAWDGEHLWNANYSENKMYKVDPGVYE